MSITFSSGGFDGTMRSDASGNIFIETTGNNKSITIAGLVEYTGSVVKSLDKATGKVIEETEKQIATGKTLYRSGSTTSNEIVMQQASTGAFISVSGSGGYNIIAPHSFRLSRKNLDSFVTGSTVGTIGFKAIDNQGNFQFNFTPTVLSSVRNANTLFTISSSGNTFTKGDISASGIFYGKQRYYTHHNFSVSNTVNQFIPQNNVIDSPTNSYFHRWIAPYDGRLVKVLAKGEVASNVSRVSLATASNGTEDSVLVADTTIAVDMDTANTSYEFVMNESSCSFNKGDALSLMFSSSNSSTAGVSMTGVWEYTVTD